MSGLHSIKNASHPAFKIKKLIEFILKVHRICPFHVV